MLKASKYEAGLKIRSPSRVVIDDDLDRPHEDNGAAATGLGALLKGFKLN